MATETFLLPDVGEGLTEAEILRWWVQPGDQVSVNQTICEIETAKAAVELPCPFAGTIDAIHVEVGQVIAVGTPIVTIAVQTAEPVLVGYGVKDASGTRPTRRARVANGSAPITGAKQRPRCRSTHGERAPRRGDPRRCSRCSGNGAVTAECLRR